MVDPEGRQVKMIDSVWHVHVLDTRSSYQAFNSKYLREAQFLHHAPLNAMNQTARPRERCKNAYEAYFRHCIPENSMAWIYPFDLGKGGYLSTVIIDYLAFSDDTQGEVSFYNRWSTYLRKRIST